MYAECATMLSCSACAVNDCNEGEFHVKTVPATISGSWKNSSSGKRSNTSLSPLNFPSLFPPPSPLSHHPLSLLHHFTPPAEDLLRVLRVGI